ncbi:hypothetical protein BBJ29_008800 [Phytophthora kernoviae]|uniref:SCP domain-containing protein n=1 Tax=Phytophthora kernoviae TaxID=325452 RepID=A0A3F2REL5_9STRA|nr:hypothetical protein BBJ29_008800 [Phytophthora kernoviae]RLN53619.1 hypothetical protein BBP00_00009279 [Phytophthora kernoviae]
MVHPQTLALFAGVAMTLDSATSFEVGSQGRVMWEGNCDFYGDDIYNVGGIPDVCGDLGTTITKSKHWGGSCGYIIDRSSTGSDTKNAKTDTIKTGQTDKKKQTSKKAKTGQASQQPTSYDNGLTSIESEEMMASINSYRSENGLSALTIDARLVAAAMVHSQDQATACTMKHDGSDGSEAWDRMGAQGYAWSVAGENVAAGQSSVSDVMTSWWNSAGHRANILKDDVLNVGFAKASNSACSEYDTYWTQDFGAE